MFENGSTTSSATKLKERCLIHKRIADIDELKTIYDFGEILGKGSFGTVVKANHKGSGIDWAIKIINKLQAGASRVMLVEREIHILKLVNHPNIILLDRVFESPKTIYLVFELCTGSLAKTFKIKKRFEEEETLTVIRSLAGALSYLHKNDIVHRDLKLENILIADNPDNPNDDLHIKVTDFGLSAVRGGTGHESMLHDCCGTLTYMAPEMIATKSYSQQCDVWSMGVIMYLLIVGKFPFYSNNDQQLHLIVKTQELDFSGIPCSSEAKHLLSKMLQKNPAFRMTAAEVENHPWISGNRAVLHAESSNVLDMMRMWKSDMMEPSMETLKISKKNSNLVKASSVLISSKVEKPSSAMTPKANTEKLSNQSLEGDKKGFWKNSLTKSVNSNSVRILESAEASSVRRNSKISSLPVASASAEPTESHSAIEESAIESPERISPINATVVEQLGNRKKFKNNERRNFRRASSRLPDFSHIPAKVDSNLANLRKEAQNERKLANQARNRRFQSTSTSTSASRKSVTAKLIQHPPLQE